MKTGKDLLGSIFPSNRSGDMEIIEYHSYHKIKVRFVNTGYETMAELGQIHKGNVKDHSLLTGYEVGTVHKSNNFGEFEIIEYNNTYNVKIRFFNTGHEYTVRASQIQDGQVRDPYAPTVYGVGITGSKYPTKVNDRDTKEYKLWNGMLERAYSPRYHSINPSYAECSVSENFKSYEYFYEWCQKQKGFNVDGWELDKDLLIKGNKLYSENTCVFLPHEINIALTNRKKLRGELPIGVGKITGSTRYQAGLRINNKKVYLGAFDTPEEAFYKYKAEKELYLKRLAFKWGVHLDPRAERALYQYTVDIDD